MGNLGGAEFLVILFVALLVLGPDKLPEAARKVGDMVGQIRKISSSFQSELRSASMIDEIGLETTARDRGHKAVAASQQAQAKLEPQTDDDGEAGEALEADHSDTPGTPLVENNDPFANTVSTLEPADPPAEPEVVKTTNSIAAANSSAAINQRQQASAAEAAALARVAEAEAELEAARAMLDSNTGAGQTVDPPADSIEMESDR